VTAADILALDGVLVTVVQKVTVAGPLKLLGFSQRSAGVELKKLTLS
jgi:hypothetical protein